MSSHTEGMLKEITSLANDCLENSNNQLQSCVIIMILKIAIVDTWPESTPLPLFRTTFLFFSFLVIRYDSHVPYEAFCVLQKCVLVMELQQNIC